jgi:hypothetical protein
MCGLQAAKAVVRLFEANQQGGALLLRRISFEIELASEESTLFRANSVAAKMYTAYVKMVGLRYLWHTLVLSVHSINDRAIEASPDNPDGTFIPPPPMHQCLDLLTAPLKNYHIFRERGADIAQFGFEFGVWAGVVAFAFEGEPIARHAWAVQARHGR